MRYLLVIFLSFILTACNVEYKVISLYDNKMNKDIVLSEEHRDDLVILVTETSTTFTVAYPRKVSESEDTLGHLIVLDKNQFSYKTTNISYVLKLSIWEKLTT